jgi:hypothetical protein
MSFRLMLACAGAAAIAVLPAAASAATGPTAPAVQAAPANDGQTIVCRKQGITGSRLARHKVCATKLEWAAHDREAEKVASEMAEAPRQGPSGN